MSEALLTLSPEEKRALVEAGLLSESEASPDPGEYLVPHRWSLFVSDLERRCACGSWVGLALCTPAVCPACGRAVGFPQDTEEVVRLGCSGELRAWRKEGSP